MPQSFRPYPEPGVDTKGTFRLWPFLRDSILLGPFQFGGLVPHFVLPFYLAYLAIKRAGLWTETVDYSVNALLVPLLQGLSLGGVLTMGYLRYATAQGRLIATKRKDRSATSDEDKSQYHVELALWSFIYLGFGTILWQHFPTTEGPGMQAAKRLVAKARLGIDLGDSWRSKKSASYGW